MSPRGRFCREPAQDRNRQNSEKRFAQEILAGARDASFRFQDGQRIGQDRLTGASELGFRQGVLDGFEPNRGRKTFSRRIALLARRERSERLAGVAEQTARRIVSVPSGLAAQALRSRLGRGFLAQGIRWPQRLADATVHFLGRDGARRSAADGQFTRPRPDRPDDHRLWYGSAEETLRAENSERRRNLVPGIFGTQRGFRSREFANGCSSRWRSLHRQRPKSLDQLRLDRRLV